MPLDSFTRSLINSNSKLKSLLAPHLTKILKPNTQYNQNITFILNSVHKSVDRSPIWFKKFLRSKHYSHDQQLTFLSNYGGLMHLNHSIDSWKFASSKNSTHHSWKQKYFESWERDFNEYWFTKVKIENKNNNLDLSCPIELLNLMSSKHIKNIVNPTITLNPDRFGNPVPQLKVKNMILSKLISIQSYLNNSCTIIPMKHLQELEKELINPTNNSLNLSNKYKQAYMSWFSNTVAVNEIGELIKPKINSIKFRPSTKLLKEYSKHLQ